MKKEQKRSCRQMHIVGNSTPNMPTKYNHVFCMFQEFCTLQADLNTQSAKICQVSICMYLLQPNKLQLCPSQPVVLASYFASRKWGDFISISWVFRARCHPGASWVRAKTRMLGRAGSLQAVPKPTSMVLPVTGILTWKMYYEWSWSFMIYHDINPYNSPYMTSNDCIRLPADGKKYGSVASSHQPGPKWQKSEWWDNVRYGEYNIEYPLVN